MTKDEALAMDLALEALKLTWDSGMPHPNILQVGKAITAIKQARSAPVQKRPQNCGTGYCSCVECVMEPAPVQTNAWPCVIAEADFEQNTITLKMQCSDYKVGAGQHWLHTTPPAAQRQWVGLTDDEFENIELGCRSTPFGKIEAMRKVEAKLKEKNA